MELDTTTFVLEIINFLVLLWLLKRFLFAPFREAMSERQAKTQAEQAAIAAQQAELTQATAQLTAEREHLAEQRAQAQQQLAAEMDQLRQQRLAQLEQDMAREKNQQQARLTASLAQQSRQQQEQAKAEALGFVHQYLARLGSPTLESAIIALFLQDMANLTSSQLEPLRQTSLTQVTIATACPIAAAQQKQVEAELTQLLGYSPRYTWALDQELIAGIRIALDGHLLEASLARGFNSFQQLDSAGKTL